MNITDNASVEILRHPLSAEIDAVWRDPVSHVHQGPQFYRHLGSQAAMAVVRDAGTVIGVAPLRIGTSRLEFGARGRNLWAVRLHSLELLGSQPLGPDSFYDELIRTLFDHFPEAQAIRLPDLPTDCAFANHVRNSQRVQHIACLYSARGERLCHVAKLPPTWPEYLSLLGRKQRANTERRIRQTLEHGGGVLKLARIETEAQLDELGTALEALGVRLSGAVGGGGRVELASLAAHGLLLGYVLYCGSTPCAVALGIKDRACFHVDSLHKGLIPPRLSPGTSLLHLVTEDLIRSGIGQIDFGFGEPGYSYTNIHTTHPRTSLLLVRRTLANRLLLASHHVFQSGINTLKRCKK